MVPLTLLFLLPCLPLSAVPSFPASAFTAKSFSVCSCQFPFLFLHLPHCLWLPFLFHFSPLLVASIHLVHNSHSINTGERVFFFFFFLIWVFLLHLCLILCRSFLLCIFSSCIYFWLQAPLLRQISGMPRQPSSSGLDCRLRQMELGCMENVHFLAPFFSLCKMKVGVSSVAVCTCSHAHSPHRSAHPCHRPWAWPQDALWPTNVRPRI